MTSPVLEPQPTPDHGPDFWAALDQQLRTDATRTMPVVTDLPAVGAPPASAPVVSLDDRRNRRLWPLVAAAVALATVGLGALLLRPMGDPATTDVVAGDEEPGAFLGEGTDGGDGSAEASTGDTGTASTDTTSTETESDVAASDDPAQIDPAPAEGEAAETTSDAGSTAEAAAGAATVMPPTYVRAFGNVDTEMWLPEPALPDGSRFLGTWEEFDVSWFSTTDPATDCDDQRHAEMLRVDGSKIALAVADPQPTFSGDLSNLSIAPDGRHVAFIAACRSQLELYTGLLSPEIGRIEDLRLGWTGRGVEDTALLLWDGATVSLNALDEAGSPFFVEVDHDAGTLAGSALPTDGPAGLVDRLVGATTDGTYTWWNAEAINGLATCDGSAPFVQTPTGEWQPAILDANDVGAVGPFAVERDSSQVAFADACPGINTARVFIGTLRADGLISSLRTIDMSAYGTGSVTLLHWFDANTLRIHIDSSNTGGGILRFDWVFDAGRDAGFLQQVD